MNSWNQFQYDSADLPFLPNSSYDSTSLESSTPFWKVSSIAEMEKSFTSSHDFSDKQTSSFMKLLNASSRSHENVSDFFDNDSVSPLVGSFDSSKQQQQHYPRRASQSLPATPLSTPYSTPAPTPNPTPQSSPLLMRKTTNSEMDAVCKAAIRCSGRLSQDQLQQQNVSKWFYLGFLPSSGKASEVGVPADSTVTTNQQQQLSRRVEGSEVNSGKANEGVARSSLGVVPANGGAPRNNRRKRGFVMSNRDMNFMAPTSM